MSLSSLKEVSAERTALSILTGLAVPVDADRVIIDAAHAYPLVTGLDASDGPKRHSQGLRFGIRGFVY
ncbi:hypothetical protein VNO77_50700 [Canavalia gladiata]|uniref:Uncharacterized protein n=1 Tax=Canavalia gladiata TaxID=3824 RepID=A0AAN9JBU0_CANGL